MTIFATSAMPPKKKKPLFKRPAANEVPLINESIVLQGTMHIARSVLDVRILQQNA